MTTQTTLQTHGPSWSGPYGERGTCLASPEGKCAGKVQSRDLGKRELPSAENINTDFFQRHECITAKPRGCKEEAAAVISLPILLALFILAILGIIIF